jgi:DNA-binding HxlR family transcriptional regulator
VAFDLTASELKILQALDSAQDKVLDFQALRRSVGLTQRGFRTIVNRLESASLIGRGGFCELTLTFNGMRALKVAA